MPAAARLLGVLAAFVPAAATGQTVWLPTTDGAWGTATNWSGGLPSATTAAAFNGTTGVSIDIDNSYSVLGISFGPNAGAYTLANPSGKPTTLTVGANGIVTSSSSNQTISGTKLTLALSAAASFLVNGSGSLTISQTDTPLATTATNTLTLGGSGSGAGSMAAIISGTGAITKSGTGTWTLSALNTYTGGTTITGGTLVAASATALGATTSAITVNSGATLGLTGNITFTSGSAAGTGISISGTGAGGSGAINNMAGANSYSGPLTLLGDTTVRAAAGTLTLGGNISLAASAPGVSTLTFNPAAGAAINVTGVITDRSSTYALNVAQAGSGTVTLSGANVEGGNTTVGAPGAVTTGTLRIGANGALPTSNSASVITVYSGALDLNNFNATAQGSLNLGGGGAGSTANVTTGTGTLTLNRDLTFDATNNPNGASISGKLALAGNAHQFTIGDSTAAADDLTISAVISDVAGSTITKSGTGTLTLSGANTYGGATTVTAGLLKLQNNTGLGSAASGTTVNAGASIQLNGPLTVSEGLTLAGLGYGGNGALWAASGSSTLTGGITLANATARIQADAGATLTVSTTNIASVGNTTLEVGGAGNVTVSSGINSGGTNGVVALNKKDAGTLTLAGSNTFAGPVDIQGGTLSVQNNTALGTTATAITVENGAALAFDSTAQGNLNTATGLATVNVNGSGVGGAGAIRNTAGANTFNGTLNVASAATLTANAGTTLTLGGAVTSSNASTLTVGTATQNGSVSIAGALSGLNLTKNGAMSGADGILTISGGGTVGTVNLNQGRLAVQSTQLNTGDFTAGSGTSLLIAAATTVKISGNAVFNSGTLDGSTGTLQVGGNHSLTFNGTINASGLTLSLGGASVGDGSAPLTVFLGGANVTVGTIVITGDTILDFGNSAGTVLSSAALLLTDPNAKVRVINWTSTPNRPLLSTVWYATSTVGNATLGGTNQTPPTNSQLGQITFDCGGTTTWVADTSSGWFDHEIRPTPEPATYGALLVSGCVVLLISRRYRNRHRRV